MSYQYGNEPEGTDWYNSHSPDEQREINNLMDQCPNCGEFVSKTSGVLSKNGGICRLCRKAEVKWEAIP